jgi:hypothetical protein
MVEPNPVFRSFAVQVAPTLRAGQAFQVLSFEGESKVVNKQWAEKCESHLTIISIAAHKPQVLRDNIKSVKVLSDAAKQAIRTAHASGKYKGREARHEPPYMAPSDNPDHYSKVCVPSLPSTRQLTVQSGALCVTTSTLAWSFVLRAGSVSVSRRRMDYQGAFSGTTLL